MSSPRGRRWEFKPAPFMLKPLQSSNLYGHSWNHLHCFALQAKVCKAAQLTVVPGPCKYEDEVEEVEGQMKTADHRLLSLLAMFTLRCFAALRFTRFRGKKLPSY